MFVLELDEPLPADDDGSAWRYTAIDTAAYGRVGLQATIGMAARYASGNVGRFALRGTQDAPLRYVVDALARLGLRGTVENTFVHYQTILSGRLSAQSDTQEAAHTALVLVGRLGFSAAHFGGSSLQTVYPIWAFPDPPTFQHDSNDDAIITLDDQLIVEDIGAGHFGVNLYGRIGALGTDTQSLRRPTNLATRLGFSSAETSAFHGNTDLAARLSLLAAVRIALRGEEVAYLGLRGLIVVNARYATDLAARLGAQGATDEQIHNEILQSGRLVLGGDTSELVHAAVDLELNSRLGMVGRLNTLQTIIAEIVAGRIDIEGFLLTQLDIEGFL